MVERFDHGAHNSFTIKDALRGRSNLVPIKTMAGSDGFKHRLKGKLLNADTSAAAKHERRAALDTDYWAAGEHDFSGCKAAGLVIAEIGAGPRAAGQLEKLVPRERTVPNGSRVWVGFANRCFQLCPLATALVED